MTKETIGVIDRLKEAAEAASFNSRIPITLSLVPAGVVVTARKGGSVKQNIISWSQITDCHINPILSYIYGLRDWPDA